MLLSSGVKQEWHKIGMSWGMSIKVKVLVIHNFLFQAGDLEKISLRVVVKDNSRMG